MFYNLTHTLAVNVDQVSPGPVEVTDFLFWLVIFFGLVLSLKLQIELSGIHWSGKVSYLPMCHCLVIPSKNQPTNPSQVPCTHPNKYTHTHIYIYIYIYMKNLTKICTRLRAFGATSALPRWLEQELATLSASRELLYLYFSTWHFQVAYRPKGGQIWEWILKHVIHWNLSFDNFFVNFMFLCSCDKIL